MNNIDWNCILSDGGSTLINKKPKIVSTRWVAHQTSDMINMNTDFLFHTKQHSTIILNRNIINVDDIVIDAMDSPDSML